MPWAIRCCGGRSRRLDPQLLWLVSSALAGVIAGLAAPSVQEEHPDPPPWDGISRVLGWMYFFCWSVSFWPQIVLNWRRKTTRGLSLDYQVLNWVGFFCYSMFNCALFWSPTVQIEYKARNNGHASAVRFNDVLFALHALLATTITLCQIFVYGRGKERKRLSTAPAPPRRPPRQSDLEEDSQFDSVCVDSSMQQQQQQDEEQDSAMVRRLRRAVVVLLAVLVLAVAVMSVLKGVAAIDIDWLDILYVLTSAKLAITVVKYLPQLHENWRRQSTQGWNIWNVLLDLGGGSLSIGQLVVDCASRNDWSGLTGDPVKFLLGNVSIIFDTIFIVQHYCLYRDTNGDDDSDDDSIHRGLLQDAEDVNWMSGADLYNATE